MNHIENDRSNNSIIVCVFVAAGTCSNRCLATIGGYTYIHTDSKVIWSALFYLFKIGKEAKNKNKQEVLGKANRLLSLIRYGPRRKRDVQQFLYCCVCIRYRDNDFTEPLPSNDSGYIYIDTQDWWEGFVKYIVVIGSSTKFNKDWFRHSKVNWGLGGCTEWWSYRPTFIF
jgi:hypothetical protein